MFVIVRTAEPPSKQPRVCPVVDEHHLAPSSIDSFFLRCADGVSGGSEAVQSRLAGSDFS